MMSRSKLYEIEPHNRGQLVFNDGECEIAWYTVQQAPTQWVAVGQIVNAPVGAAKPGSLVTSSERHERDAITSLKHRCPLHGTTEQTSGAGR
jgi:hypothetical protein